MGLLGEEDDDKCEICNGHGTYPIHNKHGSEVYSIRCPECFGSGVRDDVPADEPADLPPPSTASRIQSMDELRTYIARNRG